MPPSAASASHGSDLNRLVYGSAEPPAPILREAAGQMTLDIEPETGAIRHVCWRGVEVLRMIYANVRKEDWGTIVPQISNLHVARDGDGFRATYDAACRADGIDFVWKGTIEADSKGRLTYTMDAESRTAYRTRRTGICVLHPAQLQGTRVEVTHAENSCETGAFPTLVDPDSPFTDMAGITCEPYPGATAEIRFEGDLFEMEDQRNFSDDSFKTYVYPQHRPQPYRIEAGQRVRQVVTLKMDGPLPKSAPAVSPERAPTTPALATMVGKGDPVEGAKGLGFGRLFAGPAEFEGAKGAGLPVTLVSRDPKDAGKADGDKAEGAGFALLDGDASGLQGLTARPRIAATAGIFAGINRNRPAAGSCEGVMWAFTPQIHLFDTRTLFEATLTMPDQVATARSFSGGEIVLGPVQMKMGEEDARWNSLVGLGWTLAVLAGGSRSGTDVLAIESLGRFVGSLPQLALEDAAGWEVAGFDGTRDFLVTVLHLRRGERRRVLVTNQTPEERLLKLPVLPPSGRARILDAANVAAVAGDLGLWGRMEGGAVPPRLRPHAYVAVDFEGM